MYLLNLLISFLICIFFVPSAIAWEGQDLDSGHSIEIEQGNLVREGEKIEVYDPIDGTHSSIDISNIDSFGSNVTIEGTDEDTGDLRTFEMQD
jgi:hypothetical protein